MNRLCALLAIAAMAATILGANTNKLSHDSDDGVYNQIVVIQGNVQILNHPELGKTPASGQYLVFQRADCKQCLVATFADANGNYKIYVGRGQYKVIVRNPSPPTYDMLARDQPRFIKATSLVQENQFDIRLVVPTEK